MELQKNSYVLVENLNMNGGDLLAEHVPSYELALRRVKELINGDRNKCGLIAKYSQEDFGVYLKDPTKTNPRVSSNHGFCISVFYGKNF